MTAAVGALLGYQKVEINDLYGQSGWRFFCAGIHRITLFFFFSYVVLDIMK